MTVENDRLDKSIAASVFLHAGLVALIVFAPRLLPSFGANWGSPTGSADAGIKVNITGGLSGVALPTPPVVKDEAPANDSPGLYKSPEPNPPAPDKTAEPVPETKAPVKATPTPKPKPAAPPAPKAAAPEPPPSNAVPFGQGGKPALAYGQFSTGAGEAGIGFGDAAFGERYGAYVNAITRAVSSNWLKSMVDSRIQRAPRVYINFDIERDGSVSNVTVQQPSGIASLDRSAERAVRASSPLPPLPGDFRGSRVNVSFYFEYSR